MHKTAVVTAKALLIALFAAAVVVGLATGRCPQPRAANAERLDHVLLAASIDLYAGLLERVADHYRDGGRVETSVRLLQRALAVRLRLQPEAHRAPRLAVLKAKLVAQQRRLPTAPQRSSARSPPRQRCAN